MNLLRHPKVRKYASTASEVKFLLGGIGTGNISVGSRGQYTDFEIFNEPSKGRDIPYSFFAIRAVTEDGRGGAKVLEAELNRPYERSHGYLPGELAGLPRFRKGTVRAAYPFVGVELEEEGYPVRAELTAFTPFIPLCSDDSGIPGAYLTYTVTNVSGSPCAVSVCGSFANPVGFNGYDLFHNMQLKAKVANEEFRRGGVHGIRFYSDELPSDDRYYGSMALFTPEKETTCKPEWLCGAWWDGAHDFWDDFQSDGKLERESEKPGEASKFNAQSPLRVGSLAVSKTLAPGETQDFRFVLAWHFPNRANRWEGHLLPTVEDKKEQIVRNYYAYRFKDACAAALYLEENRARLTDLSEKFTAAMLDSTVDEAVIDAVLDTATVLRSPTCFRVREDGVFLAWEGCFTDRGCCEGNCTHVWNYAQTLAFLFPDLERSMRRTEFLDETDENGCMSFRTNTVFGDPRWDMIPATDGQLGCIVKLYRDWKFSGDDAFLRSLWDAAKRALDFAFTCWDSDGDCVLDSQQHNTYDIEFYGPNSLTNSIFFAALKAGAEMARYLGEDEKAAQWEKALAEGSARMDEMLWNGESYVQNIDDVDAYKYQYGKGCLSDQVFGQSLAHVAGLGYILPEEHVKKAVWSVWKNNFRNGFREHESVQRCYALNDDSGLLLCSWPYGGRPKFPFVYADEVWSGIEYQVASHLIREGFAEEGVQIVRAVRDRYDGYKRNPFNEVECGNHYARSLASYAVYLALCGFSFDMTKREIGFRPAQEGDFQCFVSTAEGWGVYTRRRENGKYVQRLEALFGSFDGVTIKEQ